MSCSGDRARV